MPDYKFKCPECGQKKEITMKISEYTSHGHKCDCGAELQRDITDTAKDYIANVTGFYGKTSQ